LDNILTLAFSKDKHMPPLSPLGKTGPNFARRENLIDLHFLRNKKTKQVTKRTIDTEAFHQVERKPTESQKLGSQRNST
jgi:hypothetical protein